MEGAVLPEDVMAEAANYLFTATSLYEDEDLSPDNHLEVIRRAFTTSDCQDFSWMVHLMTGWSCVRATWSIPEVGGGHHTLIRDPEGRLFDVCGYTDEADLAARYLGSRLVADGHSVVIEEVAPEPLNEFYDVDDQGVETHMARIASIVRVLPYAPFNTATFKELASRPVSGVDVPLSDYAP
jgi:hypothetical protein